MEIIGTATFKHVVLGLMNYEKKTSDYYSSPCYFFGKETSVIFFLYEY